MNTWTLWTMALEGPLVSPSWWFHLSISATSLHCEVLHTVCIDVVIRRVSLEISFSVFNDHLDI